MNPMMTERRNPTHTSESAAGLPQAIAEEPIADNADTASPPGWFQRKRARAAAKRQQEPEPAVNPGEEVELPWQEKVVRWFYGSDAVGLAVSLILHAILLIVLSFMLAKGMKGDSTYSTLISQSEESEQLETILESPQEEAGGQEHVELPQMQLLPEMQADDLTIPVPSEQSEAQANNSGEGEATGDGEGNGGAGQFRFRMPENGEAVTAGSFTAWTVPEDPNPGEDYMIVIQIRVPEHVDRYPVRDLSGLVEGTDRYRQPIGGRFARGTLPVHANNVQLTVMVPGAAQLVRDKIRLSSKILKETQTLEIVF